MNVWAIIIVIGVLTVVIRASFILLWGRMDVPKGLQRALRFVPSAVLSAIIAPELLIRDGSLALSLGNARLIAGLLAILVAWRTRNVLLTIAVGMLALWGLQWLVGI